MLSSPSSAKCLRRLHLFLHVWPSFKPCLFMLWFISYILNHPEWSRRDSAWFVTASQIVSLRNIICRVPPPPPVCCFKKQFPFWAPGMLLGYGWVAASRLGSKYMLTTKFPPRMEGRAFSPAWIARDPSNPLSPRQYSGFSTLLTGLGAWGPTL